MSDASPANTTPTAAGYRWPAEWEPHAATWISWPHNRDTWPGKFEPVPGVFAQLVRTLAQSEPVNILAGGAAVMADARRELGDLPGVTLLDIPTNDCWTRDHGPMFLSAAPDGAADLPPALIDWQYNAWGGKYPPFDHDNAVPRQLAQRLNYQRFDPGIVLEGGAVDGNGLGCLLTTEQCLLNENRNPHLSRGEVECFLADYCGATKVLWLGEGIAGDDTDGHIDELARFVGPRSVVIAVEEDPADENYAPLQDNLARLRAMTDQADQPLEVIPLPMPRAKHYRDQRLPACYANFYIANTLVVVPQFDDPADQQAIDLLTPLFPTRRVIGLPALDLVWGLGTFHCATQQQPQHRVEG